MLVEPVVLDHVLAELRPDAGQVGRAQGGRLGWTGSMVELDHAVQHQDLEQHLLVELLPVAGQLVQVGEFQRPDHGGMEEMDHPGQVKETEQRLTADQGLEAAQPGPAE